MRYSFLFSFKDSLLSISDPDGRVLPPGLEETKQLWTDIKAWEAVLNGESEVFTGDTLLSRLEELQTISHLVSWRDTQGALNLMGLLCVCVCVCVHTSFVSPLSLKVEQWTEVSLEVLARHRAGKVGGADSTLSQEHQTMLDLNSQIDSTTRQCSTRLSGENGESVRMTMGLTPQFHKLIGQALHVSCSFHCSAGVAVGFIHLITPLETWYCTLCTRNMPPPLMAVLFLCRDTKLNLFLSSNKKLSDSDWIK